MDSVGSFVNIKNHNLKFSGCNTCDGDCCNGAKGFALSPLILEDFEEVYENFPIVFSLNDRKIKAYVVLNDGKDHCKYYLDNRCSIYEKRTPACKLYPISPYFDNILIDTECPSINLEFGKDICENGKIHDDFYTNRLNNFNEKLKESMEFFESIDNINDFKFIGHVLGMPLLKYTKQSDNKYINMHLDSLIHYDSKLK
jgi:Fe-S-cluster containining protein